MLTGPRSEGVRKSPKTVALAHCALIMCVKIAASVTAGRNIFHPAAGMRGKVATVSRKSARPPFWTSKANSVMTGSPGLLPLEKRGSYRDRSGADRVGRAFHHSRNRPSVSGDSITSRSLRPFDCSTQMMFCALSITHNCGLLLLDVYLQHSFSISTNVIQGRKNVVLPGRNDFRGFWKTLDSTTRRW
jgi:hypothetical protein